MTAFAFNAVRLNGTMLAGIGAPNFERRETGVSRASDGQIHKTTESIIRAAPKASFETVAARALAVILGTGDAIPYVPLDGSNGLELIGLKLNTTGPGYASGTVHPYRKGAVGSLYLDGLSWSPADVLKARASAFFSSAAGGTDPVTSGLTTAPTLPANEEQLVLTALTVLGVSVTRAQSFDLSIDHRAENNVESVCYNTGLPYPVQVAHAGINGSTDIGLGIDTLDLDSALTGNGDIVAVFTNLNHLGVGIDTETLTVTLSNCIVREEAIPGADGGAGSRRLTARPTYNGSTQPLTITIA
jgi:hypothetical protein